MFRKICLVILCGFLSISASASVLRADEEALGCCGGVDLRVLYSGGYPDALAATLRALESKYFIGIDVVNTIDLENAYGRYRSFPEPIVILYDHDGREIGIKMGSLSEDEIADLFRRRMSPLTEIRRSAY